MVMAATPNPATSDDRAKGSRAYRTYVIENRSKSGAVASARNWIELVGPLGLEPRT
jgi:hypothetical protein